MAKSEAVKKYTLAPGAEIHWAGGVIRGGAPVPVEYLAQADVPAMVAAGTLVEA